MRGGFNEIRVVESVQFTLDPDNNVLARIDTSFRKTATVKKTQVQLASKLRWDLFVKYWDWLQSRNYVRAVDKNEFVLTPLGNEFFKVFLNYYEILHRAILIEEI